MLEKLIAKLASSPRPRPLKPWHIGLTLTLLVVATVFAKPAWTALTRPAHLQDAVAECASVANFYGLPTVNSTGARIAYSRTTESGMGVFLYDADTHQNRLVREYKEGTTPPDPRRSCLLPWSPDDRLFIYSFNVGVMERNQQRMLVCHADTAQADEIDSAVIVREPTATSFFCWLTPDTFAYFDGGARPQPTGAQQARLHVVRCQTNNWQDSIRLTLPPNGKPVTFVTALATNQIAWRQDRILWTLDLAPSESPQKFYEFTTNDLAGADLTAVSFSPETHTFLLSCQSKNDESLWTLPIGDPASRLPTQVRSTWSVRNAVPVNAGKGFAYAARKRRFQEVIIQPQFSVNPIRLFSAGDVTGIVPSANGKKLIVLGVATNELAPCIWSCDVTTGAMDCAVPCFDHPLYATRSVSLDGQLTLSADRKIPFFISLPAHFDRRSSRRYPLVVGGTMLVNYAPLFANGETVFAFIARSTWDDAAVKKWEEDTYELRQYLASMPYVDKDRVYLGSVSRETQLLSQMLVQHPDAWRGVMLLNPSGLPDVQKLGATKHPPALLISAGLAEGPQNEKRIKQYQQDAAAAGVRVEVFLQKNAEHAFISGPAIRDRMRSLITFVHGD